MPYPLSQLDVTSAAASTAARTNTRETTFALMMSNSKRKLLQRKRRTARIGDDDDGPIPPLGRGRQNHASAKASDARAECRRIVGQHVGQPVRFDACRRRRQLEESGACARFSQD